MIRTRCAVRYVVALWPMLLQSLTERLRSVRCENGAESGVGSWSYMEGAVCTPWTGVFALPWRFILVIDQRSTLQVSIRDLVIVTAVMSLLYVSSDQHPTKPEQEMIMSKKKRIRGITSQYQGLWNITHSYMLSSLRFAGSTGEWECQERK